ncbi:MAG: BPSS1780 family membrane protein [Oceanococcus sp.]
MAEFQNSVALAQPQHRPAGRGWEWIVEAWGLFKAMPGMWLGLIVLWMLIQFLAGIVPMAGLALGVLGPVINAGILFAARDQEAGHEVGVGHLLSGFKSPRFGQLALLGFLTLLLILLVAVVVGVVFAVLMGDFDADAMQWGSVQLLIGLLLFMVLTLPVLMALWFSTNLVALHELSPVAAFKMSFSGCLSNLGSLTVFSLIMIPLAVLAVLPFGLGLLVLTPVGFLAMYRSYIDIFRDAAATATHAADLG